MMRFTVVCAIAWLVCLVPEAAQAVPDRAGASRSSGGSVRETRVFVLEAGQTRIDLGRSFIVPESDSLRIDDRPMRRGDDYRINTLRGSILLVRPASGGERLEASFSRYPLPFAPVFAAHVAQGVSNVPSEELPIKPRAQKAERPSGEQYQLRLSGSKTVGFSVGSNKDLGIDQSLRVTMVGKVAKDLEVNAFLTDDNLPVQPQGNTEELKQLDKVYVQVKSKHSVVQLGDFGSGLAWSRFSSFQRELRGITASFSVAGQSFFTGGGVAKGRFKTVRFIGRAGVQGPYELLSTRGFNAVIVLPGTETVYLDGRTLKRGSENDYTIDYGLGTVTFTERVPISEDSEIVVDYQLGEDNYQRTTATAGWSSPENGTALRLRTFFFQEADDSGKPVFGALSTEERAVLAGAGDDPSKAIASGIRKVEAGAGDYVLVPADSLPEHFSFVEAGGDYHLDFYEVGAGKGDYRTDGFSSRGAVRYAFVGAGNGSFLIGQRLPLPERTRLFMIGATSEKGALFFDGEGDFSAHDANVLSTIGDRDNAGQAVRLEAGLRDLDIPSASLSASGEFSTLDDRFVSPGKARESYFYREWGLEDVPLVGVERIGAARFAVAGEKAWKAEGSYSSLSRGSSLSARKVDGQASVGNPDTRGLFLKAFDSRAGADRSRRFAQGSGALAFWHLVPRLTLESERYRALSTTLPDSGRFYRQGVLSIGGRGIGSYRANLTMSRRQTDNLDEARGDWFRARENDEIGFDGGYSAGGRIVELLLTHRRSRDVQANATDWYDLARVRGRDSWEHAGIAADVSYRLSSGEERTRERAVIFVGENQGDYDKDGREVGQKRGDYMLLYLPGEATEPVHTVELGTQASFGGGVRGIVGERDGTGWLARLKRQVSLDHSFSVLEKSRTDDLLGLYTLSPSLLQRNDLTVYGTNRLREELGLFNSSRVFKLRFTYSREDEKDNRSPGASVDVFARDLRARIESAPTDAVAITWEGGTGLRERSAAGAFEQNYRVTTASGAQTISYRLNPSTKLSLELGVERRSDEVSAAKQTSSMGTPSATASIGQRLNVSSFIRFTYTNVESGGAQPLFFLEQGLREDWSLMGQYRFTRNVSFGLNYTGRREKDYRGEVRTVHDFKMESRAYF
jgi:hypothetical protein